MIKFAYNFRRAYLRMPNQIDDEKTSLLPHQQMKCKRDKQLSFVGANGWGGWRAGAGRPSRSGLVNHMPRPKVTIHHPIHITMRVKEKLPSLRKKSLLRQFKECVRGAKEWKLYVLHFSIQSNHIHLLVEAPNNQALALGMRALAGRFAKQVRAYVAAGGHAKRSGSVFAGRYHMRILKTPTEVRNTLEYVLLNLSKHQKRIEYTDDFSSGPAFKHWQKLLGRRFHGLIRGDVEFWKSRASGGLDEILSPPRSWLAQSGWRRVC